MAGQQHVRDRAVVIDSGFEAMKRWSVRIIAIAIALYIVGWVVGRLWVVLLPVVLALVISTLLAPPVSWLRRKGWPSGVAALLVVLSFIAVFVGTVAVLTPQVAGQAPEIADSAVGGLQTIRDWLTTGPLGLSEGQITSAISAVQDRIQNSAASIGSGVFSTIGAATSAIVNLVIVLLLTFFFIKDGHKFLPWADNLAGRRAGHHTTEVLHRSWNTLGGFIRTQGLVALIDAVLIGIGLLIIGVPLAIPLAVITFFGGFIPIIGAFVAGALAVLVTLVTNDPKDALIVLILVIAVQQIEGNLLSPILQGKSLNLHAAIVLLAVTLGGSVFGIVGAFLAVPVTATLAGALRYINEQIDEAVDDEAPSQDSEAANRDDDSDASEPQEARES